MYLPLMYCIKAVVCQLYEMLYPCSCNVVISCWKSGEYDIVICRGGTDMCFVPGSGWKHLDLEQYRISGLTCPPASPLHLYILHDGKPPKTEPFFTISHLLRRRHTSKIGSASSLFPAPCRREDLPQGASPAPW